MTKQHFTEQLAITLHNYQAGLDNGDIKDGLAYLTDAFSYLLEDYDPHFNEKSFRKLIYKN